jgi:hypothetical protein
LYWWKRTAGSPNGADLQNTIPNLKHTGLIDRQLTGGIPVKSIPEQGVAFPRIYYLANKFVVVKKDRAKPA